MYTFFFNPVGVFQTSGNKLRATTKFNRTKKKISTKKIKNKNICVDLFALQTTKLKWGYLHISLFRLSLF